MKLPFRVDIVAYDHADVVSGPIAWAQRMPSILCSLGYDVRMLLFYWGTPEVGAIYKASRANGVRCETKMFGCTHENVSWLLKMIGDDRPRVCVANHVLPGWLAAGALTACGIPTIGVLRSDDDYFHGLIENFLCGRPDDRPAAVVSVSKFLTEAVRKVMPDGIVETICSGAVAPARVARWRKPFRLVYSGRFADEQKRIRLVVDAMIRSCREIDGVEGVLIGDGPEFAVVTDLVRNAQVPIRVTGRLNADEAKELLAESHAMLLFSEYEGLPTSLVEGMMAGVVPVCTQMRSGISELVLPGGNGFVIDSVEECLAVIRLLSSSRETWESASKAAREHVAGEFSVAASAAKWSDLLHRVAAGAQPFQMLPVKLDLCPPDVRFSREDDRLRPPMSRVDENQWSVRGVVQSIARALRVR